MKSEKGAKVGRVIARHFFTECRILQSQDPRVRGGPFFLPSTTSDPTKPETVGGFSLAGRP